MRSIFYETLLRSIQGGDWIPIANTLYSDGPTHTLFYVDAYRAYVKLTQLFYECIEYAGWGLSKGLLIQRRFIYEKYNIYSMYHNLDSLI